MSVAVRRRSRRHEVGLPLRDSTIDWDFISQCCTDTGSLVLAGDAGIDHHVLTAPVTHVFPYSRTSTIEIIQLRTPPP